MAVTAASADLLLLRLMHLLLLYFWQNFLTLLLLLFAFVQFAFAFAFRLARHMHYLLGVHVRQRQLFKNTIGPWLTPRAN